MRNAYADGAPAALLKRRFAWIPPAIALLAIALAPALSAPAQDAQPVDTPPAATPQQAQFLERYLSLACENLFRDAYIEKILQLARDNPALADELAKPAPDAPICRVILKALLLEDQGSPAPARQTLADLLKSLHDDDPSAPAAYFHYGRLLLKNSEPQDAARRLDRAAQLLQDADADPQTREGVYRELARAHWQQDDEQAARQAYQRLLDLDPQNLPLRLQIARELEDLDLLDMAADQYRAVAAQGEPQQQTQAYQELARLELIRNNLDESANALSAALELIGPRHWLRRELLRKLIQVEKSRGELPALVKELESVHQGAPRDLGALQDLLTVYEESGDAGQELAIQEKIAELQTADPAQRLKLAQLLSKTGNTDRAREIFQALRTQAPEDWGVLFALAALELRSGNRDDATALMQEVREARPGDGALMAQVEQWLRENRLGDALEAHLRALIARSPSEEGPIFRLATFLAEQGRYREARELVGPLIGQTSSSLRRAALHHQLGQILNTHGGTAEALEALRAAVQEDPDHLPYQLELAELLRQAGALRPARDQLSALLNTAGDTTDPELLRRADRLYFEVLQALSTETPKSPTPLEAHLQQLSLTAQDTGDLEDRLHLARWLTWAGRTEFSLPLLQEILQFDPRNREAHQLLLQLLPEMQDQAPIATALLEDVVRSLREAGEEIPLDVLRQLGQLQMAQDNTEAALEIFRQALERDPRNVQRLVDLAVAQQRAGLWYEALESWKQAYDLTGPGAQQAILRPYLAALERLQLNKRARDLLDEALKAASSEEAKLAVADEIIAFEKRNDNLPALRLRIEEKLAEQPNNTFLRQFIARILQVQGQGTEAASVLQDVAALAENPAVILSRLAARAAENGEIETAIGYLREAVSVSPNEENYRNLAELLEESYRYEEAWDAWASLLESESPRPQALLDAAAFAQRVGYLVKARELLERVLNLQPDMAAAHLDLARLEEAEGFLDTAITHYQEVLRLTAAQTAGPETTGNYPPLEVPGDQDVQQVLGQTLQTLSDRGDIVPLAVRDDYKLFWRQDRIWKPASSATYTPRFIAIRQLSRLIRARENSHPEQYRQWIARWIQSGSFSERLWAYYYTRESRELWLHLLSLSRPGVESDRQTYLSQTFTWFNLDGGNAERLITWVSDADPTERLQRERQFLVALGQYLPAHLWAGENVDEVKTLLQESGLSHGGLMTAAMLYLQNGRFSDSADLLKAARDVAPSHEQGDYAVRAAETYLMASQKDSALAMVQSILERPEHQTLENFAKAIRMSALLEGPDNYDRLRDQLEQMPTAAIPPTHRALGLALLAGFRHDQEEAGRQLQEFLQLSPRRWDTFSPQHFQLHTNSAAESYAYWNTVFRAGFSFLSWNQPELTRHLWSQALEKANRQVQEDDETLERIQLMRRLLLGLEVWETPLVRENPMLQAFLQRENTTQVRNLLDHLEDQKLLPQVISLTRMAMDRLPDAPGTLERRLFELYVKRGDFQQARKMLDEPIATGEDPADEAPPAQEEVLPEENDTRNEFDGGPSGRYRQWSLTLADAYVESGFYWQALDIYRELFPETVTDLGAIQSIIVLADQLGLDELAVAYCEIFIRQDQDRPEIYAQWARNMQRAGRVQEALERLISVFPPNHDGRAQILPSLFNLHMAAGNLEEAGEIAREIVQLDYPASMLQELVDVLEDADQPGAARELLELALNQQQSPQYLLRAEEMLVTRLLAQWKGGSPDAVTTADLQMHLRHLETLLRQTAEPQPEALRLLAQAAALPDVLPWFAGRWLDAPGAADSRDLPIQDLLAIYLQLEKLAPGESASPELEEQITQFAERRFNRRHITQVPQQELLQRLAARPELAPLRRVALDRLAETYPENLAYTTDLAVILHEQGEPELALEVLRDLELRGIVEIPDLWQAGRLYQQLGYPERARELFEQTMPNQRIAQHEDVTSSWIRALCGTPRREQAQRVLSSFYLSGTENAMDPLVTWLECSGSLERWQEMANDLNLSDRQQIQLQLALFHKALDENRLDFARDLLNYGTASYLTDPDTMQQAAELLPGHFDLATHLARYLAEQTRFADAATLIQRYLTAAGESPETDQEQMDDLAKARELLEQYQQKAAAVPKDAE